MRQERRVGLGKTGRGKVGVKGKGGEEWKETHGQIPSRGEKTESCHEVRGNKREREGEGGIGRDTA